MKQQKILKVNVTPKYMKKLMRVFTVGNVLIVSRKKKRKKANDDTGTN